MNRSDLQRLAEMRLSDAEALFAAHAFQGAYYLAGYAVECALKACIAKRTREFDFPNRRDVERSYSHNLTQLMDVADLEGDLEKEMAGDSVLKDAWGVVRVWSEASRYGLELAEGKAQNMLAAVRDGILPWLKTRW